jgi:hypothetical protein
MRRALLLLLISVLGLIGAPGVSLPAQSDPPCRVCHGPGFVPCTKHGKLLLAEQAANVQHCSVVTECRACSGALATPCKQCAQPAAATELERRHAAAREWLAGRRKAIDALTKNSVFQHLATTHFDLVWKLDGATVGEEKIDAHTRMHLYGDRLEAMRATFLETLKLAEGDLPDRCTVCMSQEQKDHGVLGPRLCGMGTANSLGLKLMGPEYVYSMWSDKRGLPDDEAVHRNIVHNVTHLFLSQVPPAMWIGNRKHGWIDEGLSHWFEDKIVGKCTNFCFEEVLLEVGAGFRGGKWRPAVRKLVDEGKVPAFAALASRNTDQLSFEEHAFVFAYIDFLIAVHGGAKLRDLIVAVKGGQTTHEAMVAIYELAPLAFETTFLPWVKATYPLQSSR